VTTEYGIRIARGRDPIVYPAATLEQAIEMREDWAAHPATGTTYTVVSRTITDWAPVDPMETS
jgi:hypothetical protein